MPALLINMSILALLPRVASTSWAAARTEARLSSETEIKDTSIDALVALMVLMMGWTLLADLARRISREGGVGDLASSMAVWAPNPFSLAPVMTTVGKCQSYGNTGNVDFGIYLSSQRVSSQTLSPLPCL